MNFSLQLHKLLFLLLQEALRLFELCFILGYSGVQITHQIVFISTLGQLVLVSFIFFNLNVFFESLDLFLVFFNNFLTEMWPFGQFIFNLLVIDYVLTQLFDNLVHLVIFIHLVFGLLWLVFKFTCQRCILNNCQFCGTDQLVFIHIQHFYFYGPNLE